TASSFFILAMRSTSFRSGSQEVNESAPSKNKITRGDIFWNMDEANVLRTIVLINLKAVF
ncbi:MAG TPA: hypothetical protein DCO90_04065, partial [Sphingobacterium sp.]|nr:hypothetical protein [Sphingobacterium sp.]